MGEVLKPGAALLCKLASIVVHADEFLSDDGHHLDRDALISLIGDAEVSSWIAEMTAMSLAPQKRTPPKDNALGDAQDRMGRDEG